jgi:hypothetical protein
VDIFGRDNVYFYSVSENNDEALSNFLGLKVNINTNKKVNQSKLARNFVGAYFLKNRNITQIVKKFIPRSFLNYTKGFVYKDDSHGDNADSFIPDELKGVIQDDWKNFNEKYINY